MIKTLQIQYSKSSAGKAAYRLHKAFLQYDIDSKIVSLQGDHMADEKIKYLPKKAKIIARFDSKIQSFLLRSINSEFGLFSYPVLGTNIAKLREVKEADIIYVHWALKGFFNYKSLEALAKLGKPIVIYMHDMWNITGGCHYSFSCKKYQLQCHDCQFFSGTKTKDLSTREFQRKIKLYSAYDNLYFVSPSRWLSDCAKQSFLTKHKPVYHLPNVLDDGLFKSIDKSVARQLFNIDSDAAVIGFGAVSVDSPYKGWTFLKKALQLLKEDEKYKNITVLIFGSGGNPLLESAIPFKTRFVGFLEDEYSTALAYNAMDVFIAPSVADNSPYTIFEAMSCGTPVVGFDTGGLPDFIKHKKNGYLAKYKDAADIVEGIDFCLNNNIKGFLPDEMKPALTIQRHLALIDSLATKNNKDAVSI